MVSSRSLLEVGLFLLFSSAVSATAAIDPDCTIKKAEYNPATGGADITCGAPVQKRGNNYPPPKPTCPKDVPSLVSLLRSKRNDDFCKSYIDTHPVVYKTVTVTTCGYKNPKCTKTTVTNVVPRTQTVTNTVTAETPTATLDVTVTDTIKTTPTITITSTVDMHQAAPTVKKRHDNRPNIPGYLKDCPPDRLSSACSSLVRDCIKTTTITKTTTISGTAPIVQASITSTVATQTNTATITPATKTFTNTVATATITVAGPETVTVTTTVCPQATMGVSGISVANPAAGHLEGVGASTIVDCCTACFQATSCTGWAFLGPNFCFYAVTAGSGGTGTPSAQCPAGLGGFALSLGGPQTLAGGPGQCFSG